jgi:hypothetical protein
MKRGLISNTAFMDPTMGSSAKVIHAVKFYKAVSIRE